MIFLVEEALRLVSKENIFGFIKKKG